MDPNRLAKPVSLVILWKTRRGPRYFNPGFPHAHGPTHGCPEFKQPSQPWLAVYMFGCFSEVIGSSTADVGLREIRRRSLPVLQGSAARGTYTSWISIDGLPTKSSSRCRSSWSGTHWFRGPSCQIISAPCCISLNHFRARKKKPQIVLCVSVEPLS